MPQRSGLEIFLPPPPHFLPSFFLFLSFYSSFLPSLLKNKEGSWMAEVIQACKDGREIMRSRNIGVPFCQLTRIRPCWPPRSLHRTLCLPPSPEDLKRLGLNRMPAPLRTRGNPQKWEGCRTLEQLRSHLSKTEAKKEKRDRSLIDTHRSTPPPSKSTPSKVTAALKLSLGRAPTTGSPHLPGKAFGTPQIEG